MPTTPEFDIDSPPAASTKEGMTEVGDDHSAARTTSGDAPPPSEDTGVHNFLAQATSPQPGAGDLDALVA